MRAITGAFVGYLGTWVTFMAALMAAWSYCGWGETCTDDDLSSADVAGCVVLLCGLSVTALVYVGLLKLQRQPRPWSVVGPAMVLSAIPFVVIPRVWELDSIFYLPAGAFALAGVVTGFEWRRILQVGAR
ncbi:hypothetical protein [Lentzea aerocolonigenes]|nr:hypothetical protein [Lentzea aerocolonigenes]